MRKTRRITLSLPLLAVAVALAVAAPARAGNTPTVSFKASDCLWFSFLMQPHFQIHAADVYPNYRESQRVWARERIYDYKRGAWSTPGDWFYGSARDDLPPLQWRNARTGEVMLDNEGPVMWFKISALGSYAPEVQFSWDEGSAGAPARSSPTSFFRSPYICTF